MLANNEEVEEELTQTINYAFMSIFQHSSRSLRRIVSSTAATALTGYASLAAAQTGIDVGNCSKIVTQINKVANFGGGIVTAISVIVFLIAGYYLLFGAGSEDAAKKGKQYLVFGVVGVVVVLAAFTVPDLVINTFQVRPACT